MLNKLLKPEPMGTAAALHQITTNLEIQALKRSGLSGIIPTVLGSIEPASMWTESF
jgi:hypothetical protein